MKKIFEFLFTLPFLCFFLAVIGVYTVSYGDKMSPTTVSYKLVIIKKSGFYNIYTFHTLEAANQTASYLKYNIDFDIKEKIIAD